jgi:hypothetical protein
MPVTVSSIVNAVINELSQVPGVATQIYASGRILQHVQDAFQMEFDDFFWPNYLAYVEVPLDGSTGMLTADVIGPLGPISDYADIQTVWPGGSNKKVMELPQSINPFTITGGTRAMYMVPSYSTPNRPIRVFPQSSAGSVVILGLQRPVMPFAMTDQLYLDGLLLQYDACWMYCVDDGTIPAQVNKFQVLAQKRRTMMKSALAQNPLPLDPRSRYNDQEFMGTGDDSFFVLDQDPLA